ncbi:unknown [Butyrivibrio sp. CAG:318]|jgi:hypothetical protein|nr:unknown [Butyrivibrio sp. CAG:318]
MQNQSKREKLIMQYKTLLQQARDTSDEREKEHLFQLASKKYNEILDEEFEDSNVGRFNE